MIEVERRWNFVVEAMEVYIFENGREEDEGDEGKLRENEMKREKVKV